MICCLDLEGVLVPEIWIQVSQKTRIRDLRLTTRDIPDYDVLMKRRLEILKKNRIKLELIQKVIATIRPLKGARVFLDRLRHKRQVIILSDTFYEFAAPLMAKLNYPTLFCNCLRVNAQGYIDGYQLRQHNGKEKAVNALRKIGFKVCAAGDSYNDITMLKAADRGVLFDPPESIAKEYPELTVTRNYAQLSKELLA